jgi:hypothetical protein
VSEKYAKFQSGCSSVEDAQVLKKEEDVVDHEESGSKKTFRVNCELLVNVHSFDDASVDSLPSHLPHSRKSLR